MATSKSRFEQSRLKPRSNKNKFECKKCGCTEFYVLDYQNSLFKILSSL